MELIVNYPGKKSLTAKIAKEHLGVSFLASLRLSFFRLLRSQKNRVKSPHDSPRPARHPGVPRVQKAAGAEKRRTESEVRRVPPRLPGPGWNSDHAGGRSRHRSFLSQYPKPTS